MWLFVTFILSRLGWSDLAIKFQYDEEFIGTEVGVISLSINWVNYRNIIVLEYNQYGIYLKPFAMFRIFNKPLFIPWTEVKEVRDRNVLFIGYKEIVVGEPVIAKLRMSAGAFNRIQVN